MKKIISLLIILNSSSSFLKAQDFVVIDSIDVSFEAQIAHVFQFVDLSEVESTSGILYEHGFPFLNIGAYDGMITDSSLSDITTFSFAYATLFGMALDDLHRLPNPAAYRNFCDTVKATNEVIPLAILHQEYHQISSTAIEDELFTIVDDQIYDVVGRPFSPYIQKELFMIAPARSNINGSTLSLRFDENLYFTNTNKIIESLEINFGDGRGYIIADFGEIITMEYDSSGTKNIVFRTIYDDGSIYYSHTNIFVEGPLERSYTIPNADFTHHISVTTTFNIPSGPITSSGGGTVHVALACGHTSIQKPLIWAEGFNPIVGGIDLSLSYLDAIERLELQQISGKPLSEYLRDEGYDLIVLDYDNGGDYLPVNAKFVEEAIKWVNEQKNAAGSYEKNVVIGQSMGGLVSRYAIRTMEVAGLDHQISTFIVFDSPQTGANVPLGAQYNLQHISRATIWFQPLYTFVQKIEDALNLANTPAARTMMKYQHHGGPNFPPSVSMHSTYYQMQNYTLGMPQNCDVLVIANGSKMGDAGKQNFSDGELVLHFKKNTFGVVNGWSGGGVGGVVGNFWAFILTLGSHAHSEIKVWSLTHFPLDHEKIYRGKLSVYVLAVIPVDYTNMTVKAKNHPGIDNAPGGYIGHAPIDISGMPSYLSPTVFKLSTFCFTPTVSVLNYYGPEEDGFLTPYKEFSNSAVEIQYDNVRDVDNFVSNSLLQDYGGVSYKNTGHTFFTSENAPFMIYHLVGTDMIANINVLPDEEIYNYGQGDLHYTTTYTYSAPRRTSGILDHSLLVHNFSKITVNGSTRIGLHFTSGYTAPNLPPFTNTGSHFAVEIKNKCDETDPINLVLDNTGKLILGDGATRTGEVRVYDNNSIIIGDGGTLTIHKDSRLTLKSGSKLIIEPGGKLINGGYVLVEDDATIEYHDGAIISLPLDESEIHFNGGDLLIKQNATFTFTGNGQLRFSAWGDHIFAEDNTRLLLNGNDSEDPILILDADADFWSNSAELEWIGIHDGKVVFEKNSRLVSIQKYFSNDVHYQANDLNRGLEVFDKTTIANAVFDEVKIYAPLFYKSAGRFNMVNSTVNNTTANSVVKIKGMGYHIGGCTFNGDAFYIIDSQNITEFSSITNTEINGADYSTVGFIDNSAAEVEIKKCDFNKLYASVHKISGKLILRCNVFNDFKYAGVVAQNSCLLDMSSSAFGGYNTFVKHQLDFGTNVALWNAQNILLANGFNYFDTQGNLPILQGTMQIWSPPSTSPIVPAQKNQWNPANTIPPISDFSVTSTITGAVVGFIRANPQSTACPATDDLITEVTALGLNLNTSAYITTEHFNDKKLVTAMDFTITRTERFDNLRNDLIALALFDEMLTYEYEEINPATRWLIGFGAEYMKHTVQHTFRTGRITRLENATGFHPGIQHYVNVLNELTSHPITTDNYVQMFYWEMDKVHLFHQLGKYDLALALLYNMESCGLDSAEQFHVNHWKYELEVEIEKINYGFEAEALDTNWVDTSGYLRPARQMFGNFGSEIISNNNINFFSCSNPRGLIKDQTSLDFSVYPNPSNGVFNITYVLPEGSTGVVVIYSIDGKEIYRFNCRTGNQFETIDISNSESGVYLYSYIVDEIEMKNGKIIIQ